MLSNPYRTSVTPVILDVGPVADIATSVAEPGTHHYRVRQLTRNELLEMSVEAVVVGTADNCDLEAESTHLSALEQADRRLDGAERQARPVRSLFGEVGRDAQRIVAVDFNGGDMMVGRTAPAARLDGDICVI